MLQAEVYHVIKLVISNSSFLSSDLEASTVQAYSKMFPDSDIAKQVKVGRTKATYLLRALSKGLQAHHAESLPKDTYFGLLSDETTKANRCKLEYYISYTKVGSDERIIEFLDSMEIAYSESTIVKALESNDISAMTDAVNQTVQGADGLVESTKTILSRHELLPENFVFVMTDNCNVMSGQTAGFKTKLKDEYPAIVDIAGCGVHHINIAVKSIKKGYLGGVIKKD